MKKNAISIFLFLSLIVNMIFFGIFYSSKDKNDTRAYNQLIDEIRFTIQRLEDYEQAPTEDTYRVAVAHMYTAEQMLQQIEKKEDIMIYADTFHSLWNVAAQHPKQIAKHLDELIDVLEEFRGQHFEAVYELQSLVDLMKNEALLVD